MDSNQAVIAAALRAYDPEMPVAQAEHAARLTAAALDNGGYAVVKLTEQQTDRHGDPVWPVDTDGPRSDGHVYLFDGHAGMRLGLNGVSTPIWEPEIAESLAAGLLAGARKWAESEKGDRDE
ncbi:hypothetical protein [Nocardia sp. NPDC051833]|uniref:hypothetical protein n=1 Tax=Nocardia sp. NPDC051833 TaxID=3155674 RepID=UPI003439C091